jgi:ectoine hydroxylase-related dioxygenase (phytanoyl-CoA dioxygenase family)
VELLTAAVHRVWERRRGADGEALHLLAFLGEDEAFLELLDWPATFPIVRDVLGWNIYMYHCHLDVHPPVGGDGKATWGWHQDGGRQNVDIDDHPRPRLSVKVAYFLSDVSEPGRGNTLIIPGSHRWDVLPRPEDGITNPEGVVPVLAGAGNAFVFDRRLWHSRSANRSRVTRKALFYAYTYRWIRPRDDMAIEPAWVERLTPVQRQLLGEGTSAIGHWIPTEEDVPLRTGA